jgi:hypothetical protein
MSRSFFIKYTPELLLLLYLAAFLVVKNPADPHDRVIISDGKGYYGYLTAIFIYHDLDFRFIEDYEQKYYGHDMIKDFRQNFNGEVVNMYFPGVALLMLPFFLLAHILALLFGLPADGYSLIYQYFIGFSALFYLWMGLRYLKQLFFDFNFGTTTTAVVLALVALGTNLNYYVLKEGAMSHVYSFAIIAAFLYYVKKAIDNFSPGNITTSALLFGLIFIIRPTNVLILLLVPFMAGSWSNFQSLLRKTFLNPPVLIRVLPFGLFFPFAMMLLWYLQSGRWLVYSYGEYGFDFLRPAFFFILFSFNKGWFVYTPLAIIAMGGLFVLFRSNRFRFWWAMAFLTTFIWVQSSWFCPTFTSNFGNRTFIDIYPFIALLLGYFITGLQKKRFAMILALPISFVLIFINNLQFYQHYKYIFPPGEITRGIYMKSFTSLVPQATAWMLAGKTPVKEFVFENDFESDYGWLNYASVTDTLAYEGNQASYAGKANAYSIGLLEDIAPLVHSENVWVKIEAQVFSNVKNSTGQLLLQLENERGSFYSHTFYLYSYNRQNRWVRMEFARRLPLPVAENDKLRVFFFNPEAAEMLLVDDLKVSVLSLHENP